MLQIDTEFKALIPSLTAQEYSLLEKSLLEEGCKFPLEVWDGVIVDGHNRYEICERHGIEYRMIEHVFSGREVAKIWIIKNQFGRRNLNNYQRAKLALQLKPLIAELARVRQVTGGKSKLPQKSSEAIETREALAKEAGVSHDTISKTEKIEVTATVEQKEELEKGFVSINEIHKKIRSTERREERVQMLMELSHEPVEELGDLGVFPVIYADPPWRYEHSKSDSRKVENQYPTMSLDEIKALEVPTTPDAILFLWATSPKLCEAIEALNAWGFTYRTCMVWVKDRIGMGYYARQRHELLLIGTKGSMVTPEAVNRPDSVIESPREEHSKKPEVVYELIERMYPELPRIELFRRKARGGWHGWGIESP